MILLNTTFYIHHSLEAEFLSWVKDVYVPSALAEGLSNPTLSLLLADVGEDVEGFALHLYADDRSTAELWHDGAGGLIRGEFLGSYGQKALSFSTYMEVLQL